MQETVVLMVSLPPILESIVESAVEGVSDVRIAGTIPTPDAVGAAIRNVNPDVVLLGLGAASAIGDFTDLLFDHPRLRLIGVTPDGRDVQACELAPKTSRFGNVSPEELVRLIKATTDGGGH